MGLGMVSRKVVGALELNILSVERTAVDRRWNYQKVKSPFSRLYLGVGGRGHVHHHGQVYTLGAGVVHLVPCFSLADYYCPERLEMMHVCFTSRIGGGRDLFELQDYQYQRAAGARESELFERLLNLNPGLGLATYDPYQPVGRYFRDQKELLPDCQRAADMLESDGLLRLLLAPILRTGQSPDQPATAGLQRFEAVFDYVEEHLAAPIRLDDLAKAAKMHKSYFASRFHALVGATPVDYLTRRRVEAAQLLLLTTGKSIKEIAFETGFGGSSAFCKSFYRLCRQTPGQYRRSHPLV